MVVRDNHGADIPLRNLATTFSRFLDRNAFVHAIAPAEDLSRVGIEQFAILFKVADINKRSLVSWDDFAVFQTLLKRSDADYWIAFKYFDV
jgi:solute carrier family 25 aspartate/glutamate transporter 12/13